MPDFNPPYLGTSTERAATEATLEQIRDSAAYLSNLDVALSSISIAVSAGLTDTQLRATPVPVSSASLPLPVGASTEATLALIKAKTDNLDVAISTRTKPADAQHTIVDSGSLGVTGTFWQTTQPVSIGTAADSTNALISTAIKPVAASTYSPSLFQNLGANTTLNVKASTGNVFSLTCNNSNGANRVIQLHNTSTVPAGGAVPVFAFLIPPLSQIVIGTDFFTTMGANFSSGIAFAFSTTLNTYTAGVAGEQSTFIQYK